MPLKSATCGRELEAGLRRRPGSNNVTFDGKPLDGVFVMHNLLGAPKLRTRAGEQLFSARRPFEPASTGHRPRLLSGPFASSVASKPTSRDKTTLRGKKIRKICFVDVEPA